LERFEKFDFFLLLVAALLMDGRGTARWSLKRVGSQKVEALACDEHIFMMELSTMTKQPC